MLDPLRELVLRTSYNKSTKLEVPVFLPEKKRRRVPLAERVVRGLLLDKTEGAAAARSFTLPCRALELAMSTDVRFEPINDTQVHRSYPSARGLFPVDVYLIFSRDGREFPFQYEESHHALLLDDCAVMGEWKEGFDLRIELAAALDKIAPLYGDLTLSLCALDIGHLTHQICAALHSLEVPFECRMMASASAAAKDASRPSISEQSIPLVDIVLSGQDYIPPREEDFTDSLRIASGILNEADQAQVVRERGWAVTPVSKSRVIHHAGKNRQFPTARTPHSCHRSSGNFTTGMYGNPASTSEIGAFAESILDDYRAWFAGQSLRPGVTILRTHPNFDVTVANGCEPNRCTVIQNGCIPLSEAYGTLYNIDPQTIPLFLLFTADFGSLMQQESSWSYLEMLIVTSIFAQRVCNDSAMRGFTARPFKGMKEDILEAAFNLPGQCFYTVLLGKSNERNLALSINSLRTIA
jgi:hypothetical protein